jgi:hypothetical protein
MPASDETDRLLQMQKQHSQGSQYYFLNKSNVDYQGGSTATVKDADGGVVIEDTPADSDPNEFAPRPLIHHAVRFLFRWSISLCCSGSMCVCVMMMVPQQRRDDDQRRASQPASQAACSPQTTTVPAVLLFSFCVFVVSPTTTNLRNCVLTLFLFLFFFAEKYHGIDESPFRAARGGGRWWWFLVETIWHEWRSQVLHGRWIGKPRTTQTAQGTDQD